LILTPQKEDSENKKPEIPKLLELLNFTSKGIYEKTTLNLNDPETYSLAFEFLQNYDVEHTFKPTKSSFEYYTLGKVILRKRIQLNTQQKLKVGVGPRKEANTNLSKRQLWTDDE